MNERPRYPCPVCGTPVDPNPAQLHWDVYVTGWPYAGAGDAKRLIADLATALGGAAIAGATAGNRFRGIFKLMGTAT